MYQLANPVAGILGPQNISASKAGRKNGLFKQPIQIKTYDLEKTFYTRHFSLAKEHFADEYLFMACLQGTQRMSFKHPKVMQPYYLYAIATDGVINKCCQITKSYTN